MEKNHLLEGKRILIVDDEPDVLETLADLLTICVVKTIDSLTPLGNQTRLDSWKAIRELVINYLEKTKGRFPLREIKREHTGVQRVFDKGAKESVRRWPNFQISGTANQKPRVNRMQQKHHLMNKKNE